MSKSKGNAVDPFEALQTYGADAIRWYFYTNSAPWLPNRFHGKAVVEGQRKFMGTLWNTYAFYVLYANIDNFDPTKYTLDTANLCVMDKWLLSKMNSMIKAVDENLDNYKIPEACKALENFVDELSNWYVRRGRERYWVQEMTQDKIDAYLTLYTALVTTAKVSAPMIPFMAEDIYRNLVCNVDKTAPESVHLCDFPKFDESLIDKELEDNMEEVLDIVVMGRSARNGSSIKNRQPLAKMYVKAENDLPKFYVEIIRDELNVKDVVFVKDMSEFSSYSFKPQLKTVGPKFGKYLGKIRTLLAEIDGNSAKAELDKTGFITLDVGEEIKLAEEDLLIDIKQKEGYFSVSDKNIAVALDTNLTDELIEEGFVNEIISKVQTMRKDSGFDVTDHIIVSIWGNEKIEKYVSENEEEIAKVVLGDKFNYSEATENAKEWDINGEKVNIAVQKI
jgi:isoleucyl-tRNA synthetase